MAERIEDSIGRNLGNILYILGSVVWAVILLALMGKEK